MNNIKKMSKSIIFEIVNYLLDEKRYECCICNENVKEFYIICKPGCINYSYCIQCIEKIKIRQKCPFTNICFNDNDICLDYKTNKILEENKQIGENIKNFFGNSIKNISINIETT